MRKLLYSLLLMIAVIQVDAADEVITGSQAHLNTPMMQFLRSQASSQKLDYHEYGEGQFRLAAMGGVTIRKIDDLLKVGEQSLQMLEKWCGKPGVFLPADINSERCLFLVIVDESRFDGLLQAARNAGVAPRPQNADLAKALRIMRATRVTVMSNEVFSRMSYLPSHWVARIATGSAIHSWFASFGHMPEAWLSQGLGSEMERLYGMRKLPLILTIEYENSQPDRNGNENWAMDVRKMVRQRSDRLEAVDDVLGMDFIARSYAQYQQMWSVSQFLRTACLSKSRRGDRYFELLLLMARDGQTSMQAIETVLDASEPKLTAVWRKWAGKQR